MCTPCAQGPRGTPSTETSLGPCCPSWNGLCSPPCVASQLLAPFGNTCCLPTPVATVLAANQWRVVKAPLPGSGADLQPAAACKRMGRVSYGVSVPPWHLRGTPAVPILLGLPPVPAMGAAMAGSRALWVSKRNHLVSKLGLDVIAAEPQKLLGQKPQKLGTLLSGAHWE